MANFIYCGTDPPVGAEGTQQLLIGPFNAIWFPPGGPAIEPAKGDLIWLVWRSASGAMPLLLGRGRVVTTGDGLIRWTNRTLPGVRPAAEALGQGGPGGQKHQTTFPEIAANGALALLAVACPLLDRQLDTLAKAFETEGGFTERLYRVRCEKRSLRPPSNRSTMSTKSTPSIKN